MNCKLSKLTIFIGIAGAAFTPEIEAQTTAKPSTPVTQNPTTTTILLRRTARPGNRPKAPSFVTAICTYSSDGYLYFDQIQASSLIVTLTGLTSGFTTEQATTPDQPIFIDTIAEDTEITCLTSDGQTFQGTIYITEL